MTDTSERQSFLNMNSPVSSTFPHRSQPVLFASPEKLLDHVTRNWRKNFVTVDLTCTPLVSLFAKRPFFLLVNVDAPLLQRYRRLQRYVFVINSLSSMMETPPSVQILYHWRNLFAKTTSASLERTYILPTRIKNHCRVFGD